MSDCVLDASAALAYFFHEPGSDLVRDLLASQQVAMSTVNLSEVVARLTDGGLTEPAIRENIADLGAELYSLDGPLAFQAGLLRPLTRSLGLSLGDRACLALAQRLNLPVYTADRAWANLQLGIPIHLIR